MMNHPFKRDVRLDEMLFELFKEDLNKMCITYEVYTMYQPVDLLEDICNECTK